jgi:predicted heme/steroid binding protein
VAELAQFDGTDESKPIYLAINGTIFDVSANRRTYGPGGSYHIFAGRDASRAFVTGCMQEDRNADLRGVEEMFMPRDDVEIDKLYTAAEMKALQVQEREAALQKVHDALAHWTGFFANSAKYSKVGYVKRDPDWLDKEPKKKLCQKAEEARPPREAPERHR